MSMSPPKVRKSWRSTGLDRAVGFLTPIGGAVAPSPSAVPWFPVVGAAIGACVGAIWYWSNVAFGPVIGAALAVVVDLALTGLLHMDGLADVADGLLAHVTVGDVFASGPEGARDPVARASAAARRLEIMADPRTGAYGAIALAAIFLLRFSAFFSISASLAGSVLLVATLWCSSRALMSLGLTAMPYARAEGGLATGFATNPSSKGISVRNWVNFTVGVAALAICAAALGTWQVRNGLAAIVVGLAMGAGVLALSMRKIGGFTGDVLGAAGVMLETTGLLAAAAHWSSIH
ncbi:MAG TPA: adenosylcobinamide-GDP ribazoletransferase [Acidimicrobiales bacterium]|nr:adenosylcobinamide-GDP ribazoletransferase [Acidimicrobiales bacterium]